MAPVVRWVVVLCAALAPLFVRAEGALVIAGGIFEDRAALAVRNGFVVVPNVTVKLYRDGGDRAPSADDAAVATTRTGADGMYVFRGLAAGDYWVAADSKTVGGQTGVWAEQTFGPAGSLCAAPDGTSRALWFEGACFGGRSGSASDDASTLPTSEHVALVSLRESATSVDFGFSFDVVTSTAEGERVQGSLRQFVNNANAVTGPNRMRFVPLDRPRERETVVGVAPRWWSIVLGAPLAELRDADTVIDGTAHNFVSPASIVNVNPGRYGESPTIKPDEVTVPRLEKPELEVTLNGATGIVCAARCGIRAVALRGAPTVLLTRADAVFEHVLIGAEPDATPAVPYGSVGIQIEGGTAVARHLLVTAQTRAGIIVGPGAHLDGERLDVSRCGQPTSGAAIVLLSNGSFIRSSTIAANPGGGIVIGSLDGSAPSHANTIDGCTISGNQAGVILGPGSSRNVITRNDFMWNRVGGVTSAPVVAGSTAPRENRVSANSFNENGLRPILLNLSAENPNELARAAATCDRDAAAANGGITPPTITNVAVTTEGTAARVVIRGRACPGEVVELYQSFVTSGVREQQPDLPQIRNPRLEARESVTNQGREMALPSVGEFNYLGTTNTNADGTFEAAFPVPLVAPMAEASRTIEETNIWASQVLPGSRPAERAFSALAIDAAGNTSEMSVRRQVE